MQIDGTDSIRKKVRFTSENVIKAFQNATIAGHTKLFSEYQSSFVGSSRFKGEALHVPLVLRLGIAEIPGRDHDEPRVFWCRMQTTNP